jgi:anti-sigma B factor antagonist
MNTAPSILVGTTDRTVWVRVEGKGSFLNSTGLKEFAKEMTNRGYRDFVVDLKNCPVMDSTFMGTLTGVALRLRELGSGGVRVVNLNERNRDLLSNLGLDQLMALDGAAADETIAATQEVLPADASDKQVRAETMLAAHQDLVDANPANEAKFKDVLEYLRQDLHIAQ